MATQKQIEGVAAALDKGWQPVSTSVMTPGGWTLLTRTDPLAVRYVVVTADGSMRPATQEDIRRWVGK